MSELFRKKSLERISSPEQLDAYIRVSTPSVWMVLAALIMLLAGVCVWGLFGHMDTTLPVAVVAQEAAVTAYVKAEDAQKVTAGAVVRIGETEGTVLSVGAEPVAVDERFTEYMRYVGGMQQGEWVYPVALDADCAQGVHAAQIVIDSVPPMFFVLN